MNENMHAMVLSYHIKIDFPTFNTDANSYGDKIQEILDEDQDLDCIDGWKKEGRLNRRL